MTIQEFVDRGFLFEVNRRVLHPFGLALEVTKDEDGNMSFGGVWDCQDDPEGIIFDDEAFRQGLAKWCDNLVKDGLERCDIRKRLIGFVVQPDPLDEDPDEDFPDGFNYGDHDFPDDPTPVEVPSRKPLKP